MTSEVPRNSDRRSDIPRVTLGLQIPTSIIREIQPFDNKATRSKSKLEKGATDKFQEGHNDHATAVPSTPRTTPRMPGILSTKYATFTGPEIDKDELSRMGSEELIAFARQFEEKDPHMARQKNFWNILVHYFSKSEDAERIRYIPPQDRQTVILEAGCHKGEMTEVLARFFDGGEFGTINDNDDVRVRYVGYDIDRAAVERAKRGNRTGEFFVGDGTNLSSIQGIPNEVDIFVSRHPHPVEALSQWPRIFTDPTPHMITWEDIFRQGYDRLRKGGFMFITNYRTDEQKVCAAILKKLDCEIIVQAKSPHSNGINYDPDVSDVDQYVLIARRRTER